MKKFYLLIISLFLISCSSAGIYKVTVTQGTLLKQEDIDKLEIGMNKDQVTFILGNPTFENFSSQMFGTISTKSQGVAKSLLKVK